jgi:hypothetical protein
MIMIDIFALIIALIALGNSIYVYMKSHRAGLQPTVTFYNGEFNPDEMTSWMISNVGKGPAFNVIVAGDDGESITPNATVMVIPSIPVGHALRLGALRQRNVLVCTYADLFDEKYTTECCTIELK